MTDGSTAPSDTRARFLVGAVTIVALGHVVALPITPRDPSLSVLGLAVAGSVAVVLATALWFDSSRRAAVGYGLGVALVATTAVALVQVVDSLPLSTVILATGFALLSYGLHRVELVTMGLVEVADSE